jgi:nicotinate-nucleotide pyrophosphorylase (carboxylating)
VKHTKAHIYDTRKTTPGWRRIEKYAVNSGGGMNHRVGLFAAVMIKDNHLALSEDHGLTPGAAVEKTKRFVAEVAEEYPYARDMIIEVEVDNFQQLKDVLPAEPDIVLLDNMSCEQLRECVAYRDQKAPAVQLEASGGVSLKTVAGIAETGVDRISIGALTHSAVNFDVGLDWS